VTESSRLDARYGRRPSNPRRVRLLAALGVGVLVALVAVLYFWSQSGRGLQYTVSGYHADSNAQITVTFSVSKGAGQRVSCRIVAQDRYTDVVGSLDVDLPEGGTEVARTVTLPTRALAVVGLIDSCRVLG
jgi:hypothetical protein